VRLPGFQLCKKLKELTKLELRKFRSILNKGGQIMGCPILIWDFAGRVLHISKGSRCWALGDGMENTKVGECPKTSSDTCTTRQCRESTSHDDNMDSSGEQNHKQRFSINRPA
jgi:hypothetical protein